MISFLKATLNSFSISMASLWAVLPVNIKTKTVSVNATGRPFNVWLERGWPMLNYHRVFGFGPSNVLLRSSTTFLLTVLMVYLLLSNLPMINNPTFAHSSQCLVSAMPANSGMAPHAATNSQHIVFQLLSWGNLQLPMATCVGAPLRGPL